MIIELNILGAITILIGFLICLPSIVYVEYKVKWGKMQKEDSPSAVHILLWIIGGATIGLGIALIMNYYGLF